MDRDGTLIADTSYPRSEDPVALTAGAGDALAELSRQGFALVIVSNQSGIGRGLITWSDVYWMHDRMVLLLKEFGVDLADALYCPHAPWEGCSCRKPSPRMIQDAALKLKTDMQRSFFVGDKASDMEAGRRAGCKTILLRHTGAESTAADFEAFSWKEVLHAILGVHP